jgi:hypothetical protein
MLVYKIQKLSHMQDVSIYLKSGSGIAPYPSDACRLNRIIKSAFYLFKRWQKTDTISTMAEG